MCPDRLKKVLKIALPLAFWLAAWQFLAMVVGLEMLLPSPLAVFRSLTALSATSKFWLSALFSLLRIFAGLLGGTLIGAALAFLTHFCHWADLLISPAVRVLRATPVVTFILLDYLWISRSNIPGLIAGLMVIPVI
jgi:NitT/TauT family transport system permease protein